MIKLLLKIIVPCRLFNVFGARAPVANSTAFYDLKRTGVKFSPGDGRTAGEQAAFQFAALVVTVGIALFGGLITGNNIRVLF